LRSTRLENCDIQAQHGSIGSQPATKALTS